MSLFGVYDGHGGAEVAEWISKKFPDILKKEIEHEKIDLNEAFGKRIQEIFVKTGNDIRLIVPVRPWQSVHVMYLEVPLLNFH